MRHLALLLALALGCSSAVDPPTRCTPGASVACACPGASGVQTCTAEGVLGACVCADAGPSVDVVTRDVVDAGAARDVPLRPADPRCADRLTARDWCGPDDGGACVDRQGDPMNCGGCGARCSAPLTECFGGICFLPADAGAPDATR